VPGIYSRKFYYPNQCGETEPKILVRLNRTDGESINRFRRGNEVTSMRRCLNCSNKTEMAMSQRVVLFSI